MVGALDRVGDGVAGVHHNVEHRLVDLTYMSQDRGNVSEVGVQFGTS
jgi:hypothetical protein